MKKLKLIHKTLKRRFYEQIKGTNLQLGIEPTQNMHLGNYMIVKKFKNMEKKKRKRNWKKKQDNNKRFSKNNKLS